MKLTPWEPFRDSEDFFRRFGSAPFFGRWPSMGRKADVEADWSPIADISETDKEYLVKAEVPGVKPAEIKVTLNDGVLSIEGERKFEKEDKNEKAHRVERFYGAFSRHFSMPDDADVAGIRAEGKDGILKVHVPKRPAPTAPAPKVIMVE